MVLNYEKDVYFMETEYDPRTAPISILRFIQTHPFYESYREHVAQSCYRVISEVIKDIEALHPSIHIMSVWWNPKKIYFRTHGPPIERDKRDNVLVYYGDVEHDNVFVMHCDDMFDWLDKKTPYESYMTSDLKYNTRKMDELKDFVKSLNKIKYLIT